jgi:hypothetical protein
MDISSDDEDFILANLELFELQPIGASSVGEYEQMQRNLQADNPTLAPRIDSRKPANQEILQPDIFETIADEFCLSDIYGANILLMERK